MLRKRYASHPLRVLNATLKGFFVAHLFWDHFYAFSPTQGPSMLPTLEVLGDGVIVDRWYRRGRGIQVGDLVTFDSVIRPGENVLKRVLGMEGDYILRDTPESGSDAMIQVSMSHADLAYFVLIKEKVPKGHCWVVGDNMEVSRDSRMFGPLPMALIKGKIIYKILPFSERGPLQNNMQPIFLD